jgi:hypothetical protein
MAFEQLRAQIAMLMDEIAAEPEDAHALQESVREKLGEMRAMGLPLPDDLVELEATLDARLMVNSGRRRPGATPPRET